MATKKQNFEQPKEAGAAASKAPARKQPGGESSSSPGQSTSMNQGQSSNEGASGQGMTGQGSTSQGAAAQRAIPPGAPGQGSTGQGTPGQGSTGQGVTGQNKTSGQNTGGDEDLLQHAKQATGEIVNQVQQQAGSQLARQKDNAATDLSQVVQAVRKFGESLTAQEGGPIARYAAEYGDKAANSLERFSTYIREQDPKQLLNDVQNFGRRRPALLLGGAFLLGLAGARLIKSSMSMESHQSFHPNTPAMRPPTSPNAL